MVFFLPKPPTPSLFCFIRYTGSVLSPSPKNWVAADNLTPFLTRPLNFKGLLCVLDQIFGAAVLLFRPEAVNGVAKLCARAPLSGSGQSPRSVTHPCIFNLKIGFALVFFFPPQTFTENIFQRFFFFPLWWGQKGQTLYCGRFVVFGCFSPKLYLNSPFPSFDLPSLAPLC